MTSRKITDVKDTVHVSSSFKIRLFVCHNALKMSLSIKYGFILSNRIALLGITMLLEHRLALNVGLKSGHRYTDVTSACFFNVQRDLLLSFRQYLKHLVYFKKCD